jgi:hypothetical protein
VNRLLRASRPPCAASLRDLRALAAIGLPAAALAAGGFALGLALGGPRAVAAQAGGTTDMDLDGLGDQIEKILGTDPFVGDTDHDGFGDLEEFARHSDPLVLGSAPQNGDVSVGMLGRASGGEVEVIVPLFLPGSDLDGLDLRLGMRIGETLLEIPPSVWLPMSNYQLTLGAQPVDAVLTLYLKIPETLVTTFGGLSFYALATPPGAPSPVTASVLNLQQSGPVTLQVVDVEDIGGTGLSSAYRPLNDPGEIPTSWSPGELCSRTTQTVGVVVKVVIQ